MCGGSTLSIDQQIANKRSSISGLSSGAMDVLKRMARFGSKLTATRGKRTGEFAKFELGTSNPIKVTERKFNELYNAGLITPDYDKGASYYDDVVPFVASAITKSALKSESTEAVAA